MWILIFINTQGGSIYVKLESVYDMEKEVLKENGRGYNRLIKYRWYGSRKEGILYEM